MLCMHVDLHMCCHSYYYMYTHRYPDTDQLQTVYGTYLLPVLQHSLSSHPVWGSTARIHALAGSMVQVYEQVRILQLVENVMVVMETDFNYRRTFNFYTLFLLKEQIDNVV